MQTWATAEATLTVSFDGAADAGADAGSSGETYHRLEIRRADFPGGASVHLEIKPQVMAGAPWRGICAD